MKREKVVFSVITAACLMLLLYVQPATAAYRKIKAQVPGIT